MHKQTVNHFSQTATVVLSLLAFGVVMVALATGWGRGYADEGSAAHIFQLLIVAEVPFAFAFLGTADWKHVGRVVAQIGVQAAALALALAPVVAFKL